MTQTPPLAGNLDTTAAVGGRLNAGAAIDWATLPAWSFVRLLGAGEWEARGRVLMIAHAKVNGRGNRIPPIPGWDDLSSFLFSTPCDVSQG